MRAIEKVYKDTPISPFQQEEQKYDPHQSWWTPGTWPCMCSFLLLFAFIVVKRCCYGLNLKTALTMRRATLRAESNLLVFIYLSY